MNHVEEIQKNPVKSTITLAIPIIVLLFLDTLYSVADIYWINGLGTSAIICMGYIANAVYTLNKIGDGIGRSVNVLISTAFGAKENEKTKIYAQHGFILIFIISLIIPLITIPFIKGICFAAGIGEYGDLIYAYLAPLLAFIILSMMGNYFSALLGSEGDTKRATIIVTAGNLVNLILDPILIFNLKLGMLGAGIATCIGCGFSFLLFVYIFKIRRDTLVKIDFEGFRFNRNISWEIIKLAIPIILDGVLISIVGIIINYGLHLYATPVACFTYVILLKIQTTAFTPIHGINKGLCIVTGHLAGAKRFITLKDTIRKIFLRVLVIAVIISIILVSFDTQIVTFFSSDHVFLSEVRNMLIFVVIITLVYPLIVGTSFVFVGLEKSIYTLYFVIFNLAMLIGFIAIFNHILGLSSLGIFSALILSNIIEAVVMLVVLRIMLNRRISETEIANV